MKIIPDTNLFFECKKLEDLPWANFTMGHIELVITKPVMREIDTHKKASGRTKKRALEIYNRITTAYIGKSTEPIIIRDDNPRVEITVDLSAKPNAALSGSLDLNVNDEAIIGIASEIVKTEDDAFLLTQDGMMVVLAQQIGVNVREIPESWKRSNKQSDEQKEINRLNEELRKYEQAEPKIDMEIKNLCDGKLKIDDQTYAPLENESVDASIQILKNSYPIQADFTAKEPHQERHAISGSLYEYRYTAPKHGDVLDYTNTSYPNWIAACTNLLQGLSTAANQHYGYDRKHLLEVRLKNSGGANAKYVRIEFEAKGDFYLFRSSNTDTDTDREDEVKQPYPPHFPAPPLPPQATVSKTLIETGSRRSGLDFADLAGLTGSLDKIAGTSRLLESLRTTGMLSNHPNNHLSLIPSFNPMVRPDLGRLNRDSDSFYYNDWPPDLPIKSGALSCERWRHGIEEEVFEVGLFFYNEGFVKGALCIKIHAENLTVPKVITIPIARSLKNLDLSKDLQNMVDELQMGNLLNTKFKDIVKP